MTTSCWAVRNPFARKKEGRRFASPRHRPRDLFSAIEATDDGTCRDERLRHFAAELLKVGLVRSDELFISTYDIESDRECFLPAGKRR